MHKLTTPPPGKDALTYTRGWIWVGARIHELATPPPPARMHELTTGGCLFICLGKDARTYTQEVCFFPWEEPGCTNRQLLPSGQDALTATGGWLDPWCQHKTRLDAAPPARRCLTGAGWRLELLTPPPSPMTLALRKSAVVRWECHSGSILTVMFVCPGPVQGRIHFNTAPPASSRDFINRGGLRVEPGRTNCNSTPSGRMHNLHPRRPVSFHEGSQDAQTATYPPRPGSTNCNRGLVISMVPAPDSAWCGPPYKSMV